MKPFLKINRVAAFFEVWLGDEFPFAKMKVKVIQEGDRSYVAISNLHVRNRETGDPEYTSGSGDSVDSALDHLLSSFTETVDEHKRGREFKEADFEWSHPDDF